MKKVLVLAMLSVMMVVLSTNLFAGEKDFLNFDLQLIPMTDDVVIVQVAGMGTPQVNERDTNFIIPPNSKRKPNGKLSMVTIASTGQTCFVSTYGDAITGLTCSAPTK